MLGKITKPRVCEWISDETWNSLNITERMYIHLKYSNNIANKDIEEQFNFSSRSGFYYFKKRVHEKLKDDVQKLNRVSS